jgi:16S rRNA (guanine966-N2)-methyltransferase
VTRIIAGRARGRRLAVPKGDGTRPTADRTREALFSALEAALGGLAGARVLDLYAGSGAVGLEALSRGAARALLVESDPRAVAVVRQNVEAVGVPGAEVVALPVARALARPAPCAFDVVYADPPFALGASELAAVLGAALAGGWVAAGAVAVVERSARDEPFDWPAGYVATRSRRYGESVLWYGRAGREVADASRVQTAPTPMAEQGD